MFSSVRAVPRSPLIAVTATATLVAGMLVAGPAAAATPPVEVLVDSAAGGYRFAQVTQGAMPGFEQPGFSDVAFATGSAAFGTPGGCARDATIHTIWAPQTDMLLRRSVALADDGRQLHLSLSVMGAVQVFVNGTDVSGGMVQSERDMCPGVDDVHIVVPDAALNRGGDNLLAIRARATPSAAFVDLRAILVATPANDDFADAIDGSALPFQHELSLLAATPEPGEPTAACPTRGDCTTAWYRVTPTRDMYLWLDGYMPDADEGGDLGLALYTGGTLDTLEVVKARAAFEDWRDLVVHVDAGVPYALQLGGTNTAGLLGAAAGVRIREAPAVTPAFEISPQAMVSTADRVRFWPGFEDQAEQLPVAFAWDFGDGTTSDEEQPSRYFKTAGTYDVTLTVTMEDGRTGTQHRTLTVTPFSGPDPVAAFDATPASPDTRTDVTFTSTASDPALVGIERWSWTFDDGATGEGEQVSHRFTTSGDHTVTLDVETFDGRHASASSTVTVTAAVLADPSAAFGAWPDSPFTGQQVWFSDQSSDPEGVGIASVEWDFGDGTTDTGSGVYHAFGSAGTYTVTLKVTTSDGRSGTASRAIEVSRAPDPSANPGWWPGDPSSVDTVQFSDGAWDPAGVGIESWRWDFGDGSTSKAQSPTHRYREDGTYALTLRVRTPDGREATAERSITVVTHDVAITKLTAAKSASVGQTKAVAVDIVNRRGAETIVVTLLRSTPQGYVQTADQRLAIAAGKTAKLSFDYSFSAEDAQMGRVTFKVVVAIDGARDALPGDNEALSAPTKVSK